MSALRAPARRADSLVEGEYVFTRRNFELIAAFMRERSGIALSEAKATLVYSRLAKRVRKLGLADFDAYCALIDSADGIAESSEMMAALTTNLTRFFREPHHFDHFRALARGELTVAARAGRRVRIWSAACSTGEEPYSLALTLLEAFPEAARHDVRILATDIDPNVVAHAREGLYREETIAPISAVQRDRWFRREASGWRVDEALRDIITFNELNLIGQWPMRGQFDVIFCRNVVIYFEEPTQVRLWERFRNVLTPGGRLYVGHSERVERPDFESDGLTIYRAIGGRGR